MNMNWFKRRMKKGALDPDEILVDSVSALGSDFHAQNRLERPLGKVSLILFLILAAAGIIYLSSRAAALQITQGDKLFSQSQQNRFFVRPIFAPRGIIYDQFERPLVENVPSLGIVFDRNLFLNSETDLRKLLTDLGTFLGKPQEFFFEMGFPENYDRTKLPSRIFVEEEVSPERILSYAANLDKFPGLQIFEGYLRRYADPFAFSHLLGFVGKISAEDLKNNPLLSNDEVIGKTGVEAYYDETLRGLGGKKIVEVDAGGRESQVRFVENPSAGLQLALTVDGGLERAAYDIFQHYTEGLKAGSIVAVDPRNGAVRALVSFPGFDANSFGSSLTKEEFSRVAENPLHPLFNRAVAGEFPSGSTIKPLIAASALQEGIINPTKKIYDEGFIEIPNPYKPGEKTIFLDWRKHGWIDFYDALAFSANVYFYMLGGGYKDQPGLGIERIKKYAEAFGFGSKTGIDLPGEKSGMVPDPSLKRALEPQNPEWRIGDTYNVSIGQGGLKVTPLQMAMLTAAIANGGKLFKPHILSEIRSNTGQTVKRIEPTLVREQIVNSENLAEVIKGMEGTVTYGTARQLGSLGVRIAAKTGTAQAGSGLPHAWLSAVVPAENPELALIVMAENAGEGSSVAVPIAKDILQWYLGNRKIR